VKNPIEFGIIEYNTINATFEIISINWNYKETAVKNFAKLPILIKDAKIQVNKIADIVSIVIQAEESFFSTGSHLPFLLLGIVSSGHLLTHEKPFK